jgi:hypothetical protein
VQAYASELSKVGAKGTTITAATNIDLGAASGQFVELDGGPDIESLGTAPVGTVRIVRITGSGGVPTFVYNATSLILPTGESILTNTGDTATFISLGSGNWVCTTYSGRTIRSTNVVVSGYVQALYGVISNIGFLSLSGGYNGVEISSGTNTFTLNVGTASLTVPAGLSGTLGTAAFLTNTTVGGNLVGLTDPSVISWPRINADNTVTARSAANTLTDLGATTAGGNFFKLTNPSAITWPRINADNTITTRSASETRTDLSLVPGTDVEAHNSNLTTIAGLSPSNDDVIQRKSGAWTNRTMTQLATDLKTPLDVYYGYSRMLGAYELLQFQSAGTTYSITGGASGTGMPLDGSSIVMPDNSGTAMRIPMPYRTSGNVRVISYWTDRTISASSSNVLIAVQPMLVKPTTNTSTLNSALGTEVTTTLTVNYSGTARYYIVDQTVDFSTVSGLDATDVMQMKGIIFRRYGADSLDTSTSNLFLAMVRIIQQ